MDNYEKSLNWYRNYINMNKDSSARRVREYVSYLQRWFSNDIKCDGMYFNQKYERKLLPMSYLVYFG